MRLTSRTQWKQLAELRAKEAELLLASRRWSGAYYLAGYAVECALKAAICKQFRRNAIPEKQFVNEVYSHDLIKLRRIASLEKDFERDSKSEPELATNWDVVKDWSEQSRYSQHSELVARDILRAITDPKSGVLTWLRRYY